MQTFKDKNQKAWHLDLNVGTALRIKNECDIDLVNFISVDSDGKPQTPALERLATDPFALVNVLFSLCRDQVKECDVDEFGFASVFDAATIERASDALMEEIINFSQPAKKKVLTRIYQTTKNFAERMDKKLDEILKSPEFEDEIENQLGKLFISMPESSESTPAPSPCAN